MAGLFPDDLGFTPEQEALRQKFIDEARNNSLYRISTHIRTTNKFIDDLAFHENKLCAKSCVCRKPGVRK